MHGTLRNKKVLVLGVAFKAHTGDVRESPALAVIKFLVEEKARVHVFDPVVDAATVHREFPNVTVENAIQAGADKATAIVVCTEWPQFREADWDQIYKDMLRPAIVFDGRLCLDKNRLEQIGFELHRIGCSSMKPAEQ
jgi:UDPglucose 6-dehydrogenase